MDKNEAIDKQLIRLSELYITRSGDNKSRERDDILKRIDYLQKQLCETEILEE